MVYSLFIVHSFFYLSGYNGGSGTSAQFTSTANEKYESSYDYSQRNKARIRGLNEAASSGVQALTLLDPHHDRPHIIITERTLLCWMSLSSGLFCKCLPFWMMFWCFILICTRLHTAKVTEVNNEPMEPICYTYYFQSGDIINVILNWVCCNLGRDYKRKPTARESVMFCQPLSWAWQRRQWWIITTTLCAYFPIKFYNSGHKIHLLIIRRVETSCLRYH